MCYTNYNNWADDNLYILRLIKLVYMSIVFRYIYNVMQMLNIVRRNNIKI